MLFQLHYNHIGSRSQRLHYCVAASFALILKSYLRTASAWAVPSDPSFRGSQTRWTPLSSTSTPDHAELPLDYPRRSDVLIALEAVRKACAVTMHLQPSTTSGIATVSKADLSPVTVGDFAAQAIVLRHLHECFPQDSFIAEESCQPLESDNQLAMEILTATGMESVEALKSSIQLGKQYELWDQIGRPARVWCLDPIDGTKGFLRGKREGGQYCVALALLENGIPTIGILGCPNLPVNPSDENFVWREDETENNNQSSRGCIFVASKGGGCYQLPYIPGSPAQKLQATKNDGSIRKISEGRFCIGVEKFSDALGQCPRTAKILLGEDALDDDGNIRNARKIDSQAKYGILARSGAEYYARLPRPGYLEWIWDHAAGNVVLSEAGGKMTDLVGQDIDFSLGAKMADTVLGVLGSNGGKFHDALVDAFQKQEALRIQSSP
jgi:3'(2'), 5'-bisphosphate nucleotidase